MPEKPKWLHSPIVIATAYTNHQIGCIGGIRPVADENILPGRVFLMDIEVKKNRTIDLDLDVAKIVNDYFLDLI